MELAAIVVPGRVGKIPSNNGSIPTLCSTDVLRNPILEWEMLGASVFQRTVDLVRGLVPLVSVAQQSTNDVYQHFDCFIKETSLKYVQNGVERLLIIELGEYLELHVQDLLRYHLARKAQHTEVYSRGESLGVRLIDAKTLCRNGVQAPYPMLASAAFEFFGYRHRLDTPAEYRKLIGEALKGRCGIVPVGREARPGVWAAEGARVSPSARLLGPCYVGKNTTIGHGALLGSGCSVEQGCRVGHGTFIYDSSLLPNTQVGSGLHVSKSVAAGSRLCHWEKELEVELNGTGLLGPTAEIEPLPNALGAASVRNFGQSTPLWPLASLNRVYGWFAE